MRHLVRGVAETPFEVMIALLSVFAGGYAATNSNTSELPGPLIDAIAGVVIAGGLGVIWARFSPGQHMWLERAALSLLVCAYACYTGVSLWHYGTSLRVFNAVAADIAVVVACAIRIRILGYALGLHPRRR